MFVDSMQSSKSSHWSSSESVRLDPEIDPDVPGLSPAEKHKRMVALVDRAFADKGEDRNDPKYKRPKVEAAAESIFEITEDEISPVYVGAGVAMGTGIIREATTQMASPPVLTLENILGGCMMDVARSTQAPTSSLFEGLRSRGGGLAAVALTGILAGYTVRSYQQLSREIKRDIEPVFRMIFHEDVNLNGLVEGIDGLINRKSSFWFSGIFDYYNPTALSYLLLIKGVALDSQGISTVPENQNSFYEEAQRHYERALALEIDEAIRNRFRYVYARSLRLSRSDQERIFAQINAISPGTHFTGLAQMERDSLQNLGIFDADQVPEEFICPITLQVINNPTRDDRGHYFEDVTIRNWVREHHINPLTNQPLNEDMLTNDPHRGQLIYAWRQTALKPR